MIRLLTLNKLDPTIGLAKNGGLLVMRRHDRFIVNLHHGRRHVVAESRNPRDWFLDVDGAPTLRLLQSFAPPGSNGLGTYLWQFEALCEGMTAVRMSYKLAWDDHKPQRVYNLTIKVSRHAKHFQEIPTHPSGS